MANNDPPGLRYLTEWEDYYIAGISTLFNQDNVRFYIYVTKNAKVYLVVQDDWTIDNPGTYIFICEYGSQYEKRHVFMNQINGLVPNAYAVYEFPIPTNINTIDAVAEYFKTVRPKAYMVKEYENSWGTYELDPFRSINKSENFGFDGFVLKGYASFTAELIPMSRNVIGIRLGLQEYLLDDPDEMHNDIKSITVFKPDGIFAVTEDLTPVNGFVPIPKKYFTYDSSTNTYSLDAMIAAKQKDHHPKIGDLVVSGVLDFSQFPVTPFPGIRYVQIGQDRTVVGLGNNWYDRPLVRSEQPLGTLKYTAEDNSTSTCTQTMDSPSPGTYYYANNKTSHGIYPKESADGSVTFILAWDSGNGLQNHDVKLYKDPYIPGLYSIHPNYEYTNVCHHGHIATDDGSHWFALPGKFVETANLGTNVDYTERRKVLMNSVNNLTVSDNYVGGFWEEGRFVALAADIPYNNQSKQAPSKRINVRSQNSNKPYNYYYGNSFLKTNEAFDNSPRSLNASIDYADEDKLPDINQDFTTNCGYNNSSRDLSDWTVSRVYYDRMKRLRFGSEDSDYSRVNYRGGVRNLTPDGITPLVGGIATLANDGTIRVQSGTKSLFTNTPQCAVIEGDIIVDATGNSNEFPLELYKKDTLVAGVLIMRGRILIKGSENLNPFIGIRNPTLVINETQWDLNQLFAVMPKPRIPRNYRVIGGILRNGDGVIFVEDTKNLGIPASISSLRDMTVVNMGKTILSDKSVFMIAGNIHTAQIQDMGYFETASFGTCKLIDEISRHITQETIPFGYNGYESISFPYYLTPRIGNDDDGRYGYPEVNARQDIYNHTLYTYDFTGKYYYTEERRGRYRKQYSWYYHTGTAEGFYDFVKNKMKTDDNRELINAKRILVSSEGASSNVVYKMTGSIDEALRSVVWNGNSRRSVNFYIFD